MNTKKNDAALLTGALIDAGFKPATAKLITAQAAHETGNFNSMLYKDYNNPFGMKYPHKRKTLAKGSAYGYATFENIMTACQDFRLFWSALKYPETFKDIAQFVATLKNKGYFSDFESYYLDGIKYFYTLYYGTN